MPEPQDQPELCIRIVDTICRVCCRGQLPALHDSVFVGIVLESLKIFGMRDCCLADKPQAVLDEYARGLHLAITLLRMNETAQWRN
jgi:hypothetical protein